MDDACGSRPSTDSSVIYTYRTVGVVSDERSRDGHRRWNEIGAVRTGMRQFERRGVESEIRWYIRRHRSGGGKKPSHRKGECRS